MTTKQKTIEQLCNVPLEICSVQTLCMDGVNKLRFNVGGKHPFLSFSDSARKYEARHLQAHAERADLAQVEGGPVCAGREVLAANGRQLRHHDH